MKRYRKLIMIFVSLSIITTFTACYFEENTTNLIKEEAKEKVYKIYIATESIDENYYLIGTGISTIITKHVDGVEAICKSRGLSLENLKYVDSGEIDLTFASSNLAHLAYKGQHYYQNQPLKNIRVIAALYPQVAQFIVAKRSGMEGINDLKNKRVAVGLANSETEMIAKLFLETHGITFNDIEPRFLDYTNAITALKDGEIDCVFINSKVPEMIVADTSAVLDINLLEIDKKVTENLTEKIPYFKKSIILPRTYSGVAKYISTASTPVLLVAREGMDDDTVYNITKTIFEFIDELESIHTLDPKIKSNDLLKYVSIPLHPGAERYYKEDGILK